MVGLGFLESRPPFARDSAAFAASSDGSVIVGWSVSQAFRWQVQEGMVGLGFPVCCNLPRSFATAVSADGSIIAGFADADLSLAGVRWAAGSPTILGPVADLSSDGSTVVGAGLRWTVSTGTVPIGPFGPEFGSPTEIGALGTSDDGSVIVGWASTCVSTTCSYDAFRWTDDEGAVLLGDAGSTTASASGVSADGGIVVGVYRTAGMPASAPLLPFVWDRANGVQSLLSVLSRLGIELGDWALSDGSSPTALMDVRVSPNGRTIVGNGINPDGEPEAWVVVLNCADDMDCDGVPDASDNCQGLRTANVADTDLNGIGNACECGDQNGDGRVNVQDLIAINLAIFDPARVTPLCDTNDDDRCDVQDIIGANLRIFGRPAYCARRPAPAG